MALISFKQFKQLNESFIGGAMTLGLAKPAVVAGVVGSKTQDLDLEEGKMKKKMMDDHDDDANVDSVRAPEAEEEHDHEEPDGDECSCGKMMKKKMKKEHFKIALGKKDDMDHDEDHEDGDDHDDDGDDIESNPDAEGNVDKGNDEKVPANISLDKAANGFMKKKAKKHMKKESAEQTPEEEAWWTSVHNMMDESPYPKHWGGISLEPTMGVVRTKQ